MKAGYFWFMVNMHSLNDQSAGLVDPVQYVIRAFIRFSFNASVHATSSPEHDDLSRLSLFLYRQSAL